MHLKCAVKKSGYFEAKTNRNRLKPISGHFVVVSLNGLGFDVLQYLLFSAQLAPNYLQNYRPEEKPALYKVKSCSANQNTHFRLFLSSLRHSYLKLHNYLIRAQLSQKLNLKSDEKSLLYKVAHRNTSSRLVYQLY